MSGVVQPLGVKVPKPRQHDAGGPRLTRHVGEEGETAEQLKERVENTEVIATAQDKLGVGIREEGSQ